MSEVKRNEQGEITHIRVGADMMSKDDATKVMYGNVDPIQIESFLKKRLGSLNHTNLIFFIADILNEKEPIFETKKKVLGYKK